MYVCVHSAILSNNQSIDCDKGEKGKEQEWMKGLVKARMREEEMKGMSGWTEGDSSDVFKLTTMPCAHAHATHMHICTTPSTLVHICHHCCDM